MPESSTTGSEPVTRYEFPEVQPQFYTRLVLRQYSRPRPGSQATKNINGYIRLPLPAVLADSFNMDVNGESLGLLGNISSGDVAGDFNRMIAAGKTASESFISGVTSGNISRITNSIAKLTALAPGVSDIAGALTPFVTGQQVQSTAQAIAGVVRNPHLTSIFEGVRLKTYEFSWKLSPKSQAEAKKMNNMINYIKGYMHPAILQNSGGFALEYPFIATVEFEGLPKEVVPKVNDSFITNMSITSSAGNGLSLYRDGQPTIIDLTLHFQEINIQTRENFGFGTSQALDVPTNNGSSQYNGGREY
jgi:hypothetical protein